MLAGCDQTPAASLIGVRPASQVAATTATQPGAMSTVMAIALPDGTGGIACVTHQGNDLDKNYDKNCYNGVMYWF